MERTLPSWSEGVSDVSASSLLHVHTRPTFSHSVIMSAVVSELGCTQLVSVILVQMSTGDYYRDDLLMELLS